jgi:hypothetical protein
MIKLKTLLPKYLHIGRRKIDRYEALAFERYIQESFPFMTKNGSVTIDSTLPSVPEDLERLEKIFMPFLECM